MKLKVKTKEQLIKEGWVENKRSIYYRLSIDGKKNESFRGGRNNVGTLTEYQVVSFLGNEVVVDKINDSDNMPYIRVKIECGDYPLYANLPYSCFKKFSVVALKKSFNKRRLVARFNDTSISYNAGRKEVTAGCRTTSYKNVQKIFNELKKKGIIN